MTTKNVVLTQLVGIVTFSIVIGMFFIQSFENWLRSNPIYWAQVPVIVAFLVVVISFCRRLLRTIP
jgi:lipopolysaccharide export LptBFGC system permease protein LptF